MQHQRRAESLIVNLRWLALLAVAFLIDEGESRVVLVAIPSALFLYNLAAYYICSDAELYRRFNVWPGYAVRGFDLLVITFMTMLLGADENAIYLLYSIVIVGAGFVYGIPTAVGTCLISGCLFYTAGRLSGTGAAFQPTHIARLSLLPVSVLVGTYLSREFEREWSRIESYKRLEGIYQLGASFNERLDTNQILHKTIETALELMSADRCVMTLYSPNTEQVERQAELIRPGAGQIASTEESQVIVTEFQSQVQATSTPSQVSKKTDDASAQPTARIETPLSAGSRIVGKLEVESWDPETKLGGNEAQLLTILATQAAIAIQNARMVEDLQSQAETDPLTGLLNRRMLIQRIAYETKKAAEGDYPLCVWIFDLDNFKYINDNYGHLAGDVVLQQLGGALHDATRHGDFSVRYGGDEFLVVLRNVDIQNAMPAINRIKNNLENMAFDVAENTRCAIKLSGGLSCTSLDGHDARELIRRADDRLLRAKHCGKNRICGPRKSSRPGGDSEETAA